MANTSIVNLGGLHHGPLLTSPAGAPLIILILPALLRPARSLLPLQMGKHRGVPGSPATTRSGDSTG